MLASLTYFLEVFSIHYEKEESMMRSSIVQGPQRSFERDHPFNTYAKFFEKLTFLPSDTYTYLFISVYEHISYHALNTSDISHRKYFIVFFF